MKKLLTTLILGLVLSPFAFAVPAIAADDDPPPPQPCELDRTCDPEPCELDQTCTPPTPPACDTLPATEALVETLATEADRVQRTADRRAATIQRLRAKIRALR